MNGAIVLVVEDDQVNRLLALKQLEKLGVEARAATGGPEALDALASGGVSLLLLDCQMPEMDGFEVARAIRDGERRSGGHVPIVAMTANATDADRRACFDAGMDDFLPKPVRLENLVVTLERWLGMGGPPSDVPEAGGDGAGSAVPETGGVIPGRHDGVSDGSVLTRLAAELGSEEAARSIIEAFLARLPERQAAIRSAIAQEDAPSLRAAAHALKGPSAIFGADRLVERCRELEAMGSAGSTIGAETLTAAVIETSDDLARALASLI